MICQTEFRAIEIHRSTRVTIDKNTNYHSEVTYYNHTRQKYGCGHNIFIKTTIYRL